MAKEKKPTKKRWLGARADDPLADEVDAYVAADPDLTMGSLLRKAVKEYMLNHPLKQPESAPTQIKAPGE